MLKSKVNTRIPPTLTPATTIMSTNGSRTSIEKGAPSPLGARQGVPLFIWREGHFLLKAPRSRIASTVVKKSSVNSCVEKEKVDPTSGKRGPRSVKSSVALA